jgi:hypothetical protein
MNVGAVVVTGNATTRYNCLAWTLGVNDELAMALGDKGSNEGGFRRILSRLWFCPLRCRANRGFRAESE